MFSNEVMQNFYIGLEITLYAMGGVFSVLCLFYLMVKLMVKLSSRFARKHTESE